MPAIEATDWVTTSRIQDGQVTAAKCAADVASQAELDAETSSRQSADSGLSTRLDTAEAKVSYTDPVSQTQVTSQIATAVADLVDSAPGTLDTLNDLAAALADDADFSTTIAGQIGAKQDGSAHLTSVVTAARTVPQLQSLDTTSSIQDALNLKAADNTCVKLTGAQTIAGVKEFSDQISTAE